MATTVVDVLVPPLPDRYSYVLPENLSETEIGYCVAVPLGRRKSSGYIIGKQRLEDGAGARGYQLKSIESIHGHYRHFDPSQIPFFEWVSNYYGEPLSRVLEVAVPPSVPSKFRRRVTLTELETESSVKGSLQRRIIESLKKHNQTQYYDELSRKFPGAKAALEALQQKNMVRISSEELLDHYLSNEKLPEWAKNDVDLNQQQQDAFREICTAISEKRSSSYLLHGITGSGKTEVYIEAANFARAQGKGVLVIVPEIALTPQLIDRFRARLGHNIAVLHSALNKRARWDAWRALLEGRANLAIGARSAIFAPVTNLGLIIVDEEHDQSYKQSEGLRYHARDLALIRGRMDTCPVVLGSATPSLESYANALRKRYHLLALPSRHGGATLSSIEMVDLNRLKPWEMASKNVSPRLYEELNGALERGEQSFILYNRRGFATFLQCQTCEEVLQCPHCSVTLTYHREKQLLLCHYCGFNMYPPTYCGKCAQKDKSAAAGEDKENDDGKYVQRGAGTERIFEEIKQLFPEALVERLDRDSASNMDEYRAILNRVRNRETQILVGTQMIAKGHDLPDVTLVGVADCDVGLHMPDFRASERGFQLLTQAAGRAGRAEKPGRVILQTRVPQHHCILTTLAKDYRAFASQELKARKVLLYPPFARLLRIVASSPEQRYPESVLAAFRDHAQNYITKEKLDVTVLGPCPCPISRVKNEWRVHLVLKSVTVSPLHKVLGLLRGLKIKTTKVRLVFDVDPYEML